MSEQNSLKTYPGETTDVTWDRRLCIHVQECSRARGDLFVGGREPWCDPNVVDLDNVVEVVKRCPTGALDYQPKDGSASESPASNNRVTVSNQGPLYLTGELEIAGAPDDMLGVRFRAALCRCGQSKNKPFCDNSHETSGFKDRGAVGRSGESLEAEGGPLSIRPMPDGALVFKGNLTIVAGSGRVAWQGTKAVLCRCGHSKNKPFCDGSHRAAGFKAP